MQSVDTGAACDAAALQNERSASIQSIHEESVLTDQVYYDIEAFHCKNPLSSGKVKAGMSR